MKFDTHSEGETKMLSTGVNIPAVTEEDIEQARQKVITRSGRPSIYSAEMAAEILERLESGESITSICKDERMPGTTTVNAWKRHLPEFAAAFKRARQFAAAVKVDEGRDAIDALKDSDELSMTKIRLAEVQFKSAMETAKCYDRETFGNQVTVENRGTIEIGVSGMLERMQSAGVQVQQIEVIQDPILEERRRLMEAAEDAELNGDLEQLSIP